VVLTLPITLPGVQLSLSIIMSIIDRNPAACTCKKLYVSRSTIIVAVILEPHHFPLLSISALAAEAPVAVRIVCRKAGRLWIAELA